MNDNFGEFFLKWICISVVLYAIMYYFTSLIFLSYIISSFGGLFVIFIWEEYILYSLRERKNRIKG